MSNEKAEIKKKKTINKKTVKKPETIKETNIKEKIENQFEIDVFPSKGSKTQVLQFKDASTIGASVLVPQFGSDYADIQQGKVDTRRLTNITKIERIWLSYFRLVPEKYGGEFAKDFCSMWDNYSMSLDGKRATQLILMQGAVTGGVLRTKRGEDKRSWIQKHIT